MHTQIINIDDKLASIRLKHLKILDPKSPTQTGLDYVKKQQRKIISHLGTFNLLVNDQGSQRDVVNLG